MHHKKIKLAVRKQLKKQFPNWKSLSRKTLIDHTQLYQFRLGLSFTQQSTLVVYFLHYFYKSGLLGDCLLHGIDSTELANECRILLASGNHHVSHFLPSLVKQAQVIGLEIQLVTADEAYHDKDDSLFQEILGIVTTLPSAKVLIPQHVDNDNGAVSCSDSCNIAMQQIGFKDQTHEYKCGAEPGECQHFCSCPQYRYVAVDGGQFQQIPTVIKQINQAYTVRRNCEWPFNILKNLAGMEIDRVQSQHATMVYTH